jgi:hypothetical protein
MQYGVYEFSHNSLNVHDAKNSLTGIFLSCAATVERGAARRAKDEATAMLFATCASTLAVFVSLI